MMTRDLALVTDRWDEAGGGRERYVAELAGYLTRHGCGVEVYCRGVRTAALESDRLKLRQITGPVRSSEARLRGAVELSRARLPENPVLTMRPLLGATHYQLHSGLYAQAFEAERTSLESTLRRHLFWPAMRVNSARMRLLRTEEQLLSGAARPKLMVFSRALADELQRRHAVRPDEIEVVRPGVDLSRFHPPAEWIGDASRAERALRLLFVGHNFVLKGLYPLLRALPRATRLGLDATLTVAGDGPVRTFRRLSERVGLAGKVAFLGNVDQKVLANLYRRSDMLVHPTFYDPFPRAILEALASGCPVITTRACGASEILTDGTHGYVIDDPRNTEALVNAMGALADRDRLARVRANAAALGSRFNFETHAREVVNWLGLSQSIACREPSVFAVRRGTASAAPGRT